jgi:hypothetical protein
MSHSELASQALYVVLQHIMLPDELKNWYPTATERNVLVLKEEIITHQLKISQQQQQQQQQDVTDKETKEVSPSEEDRTYYPLHQTTTSDMEIDKNSSKYILDMIAVFEKQRLLQIANNSNKPKVADHNHPFNHRNARKVINIYLVDF